MKKQKVRPMVDKDLRDEVINYCGGGESFNSALRYYAKGKSRAENFANIYNSKVKAQEEAMHSLYGQAKHRELQVMKLKQNMAALGDELEFTRMELQKSKNKSQVRQFIVENQALKNQLKRDTQELNRLKEVNAELSTTLDGTDKAYKSLFELYMEKKDRGFIYFCLGMAIGAAVMTFVFNVM